MTAFRALVWAHWAGFARDRMSLFFSFAFPVAFIVVFGLIFGGNTAPDGRHVINYIVPGVMSWGVATSALFGVAYTIMHWRSHDVLRLVRMTPVPLPTLLISRFVVTAIVGVIQAVLFVGIGLLPWLGVTVSATGTLISLAVLLDGMLAFFAIGLVIGNYASSPEAVAALANVIMIPMAYLSGSFIPSYSWPAWLRGVSQALPLRYMNQGITAVLDGRSFHATDVLVPLVVLLAFAAAFGLLATRTFKWSAQS